MASRILSEAQLDEAAELRESGWAVRRIAAHFSAHGTAVSEGAVGWHLLRLGVELPPERRRPSGGRCGRGRSFTADEDALLLAREAEGATLTELATALGRGTNSIIGRLATLARIQARAEEEA